MPKLWILLFAGILSVVPGALQAETPLQKCRAAIEHDLAGLNQDYIERLTELRAVFQRAGNLVAYLDVDSEIKRFQKENSIGPQHVNKDIRTMRWTQEAFIKERLKSEYEIAAVTLASLEPQMMSLTQSGKIDEAIAVKTTIDTIRSTYASAFAAYEPEKKSEIDDSHIVPADELAQFCRSNEKVAMNVFKGSTVTVRGLIDSFPTKLSNPGKAILLLRGDGADSGKIECHFNLTDLGLKVSPASKPKKLILISNARSSRASGEMSDDDGSATITLEEGSICFVEGIYDGNHLHPKLVDCRFAEPEELVEETADESTTTDDSEDTPENK
jgi:hypothetical protein